MTESTSPHHIVVAGYFPPPTTGQAVATERVAGLLDSAGELVRVSLQGTHSRGVRAEAAPTLSGTLGYARAARAWRRELRRYPSATVLWTSISAKAAGHLRDTLLVLPAFAPSQRVFGVVHWGGFERLGAVPWMRPLVARMVRRLNGVVFLDRSLADACAGFIPEHKRLVVPNTISDDVIASGPELDVRRAPWAESRALRVLFFSNMLPEKGYGDVVRAIGRMRSDGVAVEATFAGAWPDDGQAHRFAHLVEECGAGDAATYVGAVRERADVRRLMLGHDVLAFPSSYASEAQPLVILEAFACGTPIVTTTVGAIPNIVTDGVEGRLVMPGDAAAVADALMQFQDRAWWLAASHAARARFDAQFSPDVVRRAWLHAISTVPPSRHDDATGSRHGPYP